MKHILTPETAWKFGEYGREVWGLTGGDDMAIAEVAIEKTASFFYDVLGLPRTLTEAGIGEENLAIMAQNCALMLQGAFVPLSEKDVLEIFRACL
jgi:alcohol dehydrogenase YqhD (iron-dependent ADH family)